MVMTGQKLTIIYLMSTRVRDEVFYCLSLLVRVKIEKMIYCLCERVSLMMIMNELLNYC